MKKRISNLLALLMCTCLCVCMTACGSKADYTVGIVQLMEHESLDKATKGFMDALTEEMTVAGKTVEYDLQVAGEANLCTTVVNTFTAKNVDLIMANATPVLLAAANATTKNQIPVVGTSVTDYMDTFANAIPTNVTGTSDGVPFDEQAKMMIDTLYLQKGDSVGVLYCSNESNSVIQYEAVKALFESEGIVVKAYTFSETTELQGIVNRAASESKAIYVPSDNTVADNDAIVGTICNDKKVPVYTSYGGKICYASLAIDYYELGRVTGKMAADTLLGKATPSEIDIEYLTPTSSYNEDLCNLLGIEIK